MRVRVKQRDVHREVGSKAACYRPAVVRIHAEFGTPDFDAEYQAAINGHAKPSKRTAAGTLAWRNDAVGRRAGGRYHSGTTRVIYMARPFSWSGVASCVCVLSNETFTAKSAQKPLVIVPLSSGSTPSSARRISTPNIKRPSMDTPSHQSERRPALLLGCLNAIEKRRLGATCRWKRASSAKPSSHISSALRAASHSRRSPARPS